VEREIQVVSLWALLQKWGDIASYTSLFFEAANGGAGDRANGFILTA